MTMPQWALLGFAVWTLLVLFGTVGIYRWTRILSGKVAIAEWRADEVQGSDWYRRAMRAHANCIENLPVFAAIVFCATVAGAQSRLIDILAVIVLTARIGQTATHLAVPQTNFAASIRFALFLTQALCMLALAVVTATWAAAQ